ncbi:hypothetical protein ACFQZ4_20930 [Catellatospora coxensis]
MNMAAAAPADHTAYGNLLAFNDFHGAIDPPTGSGAAVLGTPRAVSNTWPTGSRSCVPRARRPARRSSPSARAT